MMGSPYYYDVLFDDGPGDVVFHDCMWSGICTCCIQLLHQDSYYQFANESPDLKVEDLNIQQHQIQHQTQHQALHQSQHQSHQTQQQIQCRTQSALDNSPDNSNPPLSLSSSSSTTSSSTTSSLASSAINVQPRSIQIAHNNPKSTQLFPDQPGLHLDETSPKPLRRREHNDSERKRRDHLRNAFNFLRDQVPRFKQMNKKPPRIQILHEATKYVQCVMRESQDLERRLEEERAKHARLKQQSNNQH